MLVGKCVIRFSRNSFTVIICDCVCVCVCVGGRVVVVVVVVVAGAKAGGVQLMMLVALDSDQILDAPLIEKR